MKLRTRNHKLGSPIAMTQNAPPPQISEAAVLAHLSGRPVIIKRIARFLSNRYGAFVDLRDFATKTEAERIEHLLTRSLAAHAVAAFAKLSPDAAARQVVDGGQDLGIDALAFDEVDKRCWLFQSKFQHSGTGLMAWSDMSKFLDGFDALASERLDGANAKILAFESDIRRAATEPGWRYTLVLASTSKEPLEPSHVQQIEERLSYQDPGNTGTFTFEPFTLNAVTRSVETAFDPAKINLFVGTVPKGQVMNHAPRRRDRSVTKGA